MGTTRINEDVVAKLLEKAESATPEEAQLLTDKAMQLMTRYSIDQATIDAARQVTARSAERIVEGERIECTGIYRNALVTLAARVAVGLDVVRPVCVAGYGKYAPQVRFVGFESDVRQAETLFRSLMLQAVVAMRAWWSSDEFYLQRQLFTKMEGFKERRDFILGFAYGVQTRLEQARVAAVAESDAESDDSTPGAALVLTSRRDRVDRWVEENMDLRPGRASRHDGGTGRSYRYGEREGRRAVTGARGELTRERRALSGGDGS